MPRGFSQRSQVEKRSFLVPSACCYSRESTGKNEEKKGFSSQRCFYPKNMRCWRCINSRFQLRRWMANPCAGSFVPWATMVFSNDAKKRGESMYGRQRLTVPSVCIVEKKENRI
jgi:hypothetical protein